MATISLRAITTYSLATRVGALVLFGVFFAPSTAFSAETRFESPVPYDVGAAKGITVLPSGEVWAIDNRDSATRSSVVRVRATGEVVKLRLPGTKPQVTKYTSIALGADGNVWVAARYAPYKTRTTFFRMGPSGTVKRFVSPEALIAYAMTPAPDGTLWLVDQARGRARLARLSTDGVIRYLEFATGAPLEAIAQGSNGDMWVAGLKVLFRFKGTRLIKRYSVERNEAGSITPLPNGQVVVPGEHHLQIIGSKTSKLSTVSSGAFPILASFLTADGSVGFTSGGLGGDDYGPRISGSLLWVLNGDETGFIDAVWKSGIDWVANFVDDVDVAISPGLNTVAVDQSGNLWAGTDWRKWSGLTRFSPSTPRLPTPGSIRVTGTQRKGDVYIVRLKCDGEVAQFCTGSTRIALKNAGRASVTKQFALRTSTRSTMSISLRRGESIRRVSTRKLAH